jgi:hypothetical protein
MDQTNEKPSQPARPGDLYLAMLIGMTENQTAEVPITFDVTLNVGGMLVSGRLIGHDLFMRQFMGGVIDDAIRSAVEEGKVPPFEETGERHFIHLENARFFMPGNVPIPTTGPGVLWRGRLDAVDGFTMGELRVGDRKP